jgi:hypothetical protein
MSLRKKIKNNENISFNHPNIAVEFFSKKYYKVYLKQHNDDWSRILNDTLDKIEVDKLENADKSITYYYLKRNEYNDFIELVENVERKLKRSHSEEEKDNNEDEEESESSSESDSSTDDELIQKTLTRRLTSQSKGHEIDQGHVSDSEMEDVISICRRFRAVYKLITNMAVRIERLENLLLPPK